MPQECELVSETLVLDSAWHAAETRRLESAQHGAAKMRRTTLLFAAATASATLITADIGNSRQLHLHAAHTIE